MKYGYARVSTAEQSFDSQIAELTAVGCEKIFREKISGSKSNSDRPELSAMLSEVRSGDHVFVTKIDRASRSTADLLALIKTLGEKGAQFTALNSPIDTTSPVGEMMVSILASVAQFERALMLERQTAGIKKAQAEGKYKGRKPTAKLKSEQVIKLSNAGITKKEIAETLKISEASIYRILAAAKIKN